MSLTGLGVPGSSLEFRYAPPVRSVTGFPPGRMHRSA